MDQNILVSRQTDQLYNQIVEKFWTLWWATVFKKQKIRTLNYYYCGIANISSFTLYMYRTY